MEDETKSMAGRTVLVTGATSGIGEAASLALARCGAQVVMVGRDPGKIERSMEMIRREAPGAQVESLQGDLSSMKEVLRVAAEYKRRFGSLHVLLNNAGGAYTRRRVSVDGLELTFALNHMGYFLLTLALLDRLEESAPARVVNVASHAHFSGKMNFDDPMGEKKFGLWAAYAQSKLANVLFTFELARRLDPAKVTANALHPGVVATNIGRDDTWLGALVSVFFRVFGISPASGARTMVYLSSSHKIQGVTGKYFYREAEAKCSREARSTEVARRLWELSEKLAGDHLPVKLPPL